MMTVLAKITTLDQYIDGLIYNGPIKKGMCRSLEVSFAGCPYRGTSVCTKCPFEPVAECTYMCLKAGGNGAKRWDVPCEHRAVCKCGWDQTARLQAWGLVG